MDDNRDQHLTSHFYTNTTATQVIVVVCTSRLYQANLVYLKRVKSVLKMNVRKSLNPVYKKFIRKKKNMSTSMKHNEYR